MVNNISELTAAIQITPTSQAVQKIKDSGEAVTVSAGQVKQADNSLNLFAFNSYVNMVESQLSLVDPKNDADKSTNGIVNSVQGVVAAYQTAQQIASPVVAPTTDIQS